MFDYEKEYDRRERTPLYWFNKSSDLLGAAGALWYCIHERETKIPEKLGLGSGFDMGIATYPVYRMLCGMSLELLYKAIIVVKGDRVKTGHDLVVLAGDAGLELNSNTRGILTVLTECIVWDGRYPVPKARSRDSIRKLNRLFTKHFFTSSKRGELKILTPVAPDPLDWSEFNGLWTEGSNIFWKYYSG